MCSQWGLHFVSTQVSGLFALSVWTLVVVWNGPGQWWPHYWYKSGEKCAPQEHRVPQLKWPLGLALVTYFQRMEGREKQ